MKYTTDSKTNMTSELLLLTLHFAWHHCSTPGKIGYGFDAGNTIMIDDTMRKMRNFPDNVIVGRLGIG